MNPMETNKTFKVWLNPLRFAPPNIDAQLHKARRVQLMELEIKPFQNTNHKRMWRKPQPSLKELSIYNHLILMRLRNSLALR
jgi:hypothetical protein